MFNRINEQKTMKKFWNLMLVALVMLGAAACTENNDTVDVNAESLSFYAEIANEDTRADLEYDQQSKLWKTVWEGNETINVKSGLKGFDFTNSKEEPNKFTCTAPGVSNLANKTVTVSISNKDQSTVGKKGLVVNTVIDSFDTSKTISLTAANSFLRYAYNGEGELTISLTYANGAKSFVYDNQAYDSVTFKGGNGENWVSFNPQEGEATLSYSINGVECKRKAINVIAGKIYNLGELVPAEYLYFVPNNNWKSDNAWFAAHFYNANDGYADIKLADDNNDGVYECVVPTAMTGVTFCRMNPAFTEFGWNEEGKEEQHVWNQTGGLTIDKDNNYFYLYTDSWSEGVWNVAGYVVGATPRNFGLAGLNGNWDTDIDMTLEGDYFTLKRVKIAATDTFKLRVNDSWNENYGASGDVEPFTIEANKGYTLSAGGKDLNITAGTYDIYFNDTTKALYVMTVGKTPADILPEGGDENVNIGIAGSFQGWDAANPVAMSSVGNGWIVAYSVELMKSDEFKFVQNNSWDVSYGYNDGVLVAEPEKEYTLVSDDGKNIKVNANGKFDVYFNTVNHNFKYVCVEDYANTKVNITINNKANWSPLNIYLEYNGTAITSEKGDEVSNNTYAVSGKYIGETLTCKFISGSKVSDVMSVAITKNGATVTLEETIVKLYFQLDTSNAKQWWGNTTKIHVWKTGTSFDTEWPGNTMTSEGNYTWSIIVPSELVGKTINFLVHNGNNWKSSDSQVTIKAEGNTVTGSSIGIK